MHEHIFNHCIYIFNAQNELHVKMILQLFRDSDINFIDETNKCILCPVLTRNNEINCCI